MRTSQPKFPLPFRSDDCCWRFCVTAPIQAVEEQDFVTQARDAKRARLREARLAKESDDRARATSALITRRAKPA
ncbi:hypothetical protein CN230_31370 [Sinorhizobium meliloti]|nr:hypothetical protein CN230_31370 [Sinorhizobium meliloti]